MKRYVKFLGKFSFGALLLCACDLQPKIASIPDSIGMFIEDRYPALLADPQTQPEIYNSAASDYGVYASPELYGSSNINDYVLYASVDDYILTPQEETAPVQESPVVISDTTQDEDVLFVPDYKKPQPGAEVRAEPADTIIVARGDTLYSLARKNNMTVSELAKINNLQEPYTLSVGQKLKTRVAVAEIKEVPKPVQKPVATKETKTVSGQAKEPVKTTKRVDLQEITVQKGDTLYSISRRYEIPVNDLAVINKISAPFNVTAGQKIKVPKLENVKTGSVSKPTVKETTAQPVVAKTAKQPVQNTKSVDKVQTKKPETTTPKQKISSDPKKPIPKITARSSSKFSWPVRGKILSSYGAKNNGLFNDGINISASLGTSVKAAENGVVAYAGNEVKGMGNLIIVQHSDGWMTIYAHLDSMSVRRGARVNVGSVIGTVGKTGKVDKPQLHFEIRKGTKAYNPSQYLKK